MLRSLFFVAIVVSGLLSLAGFGLLIFALLDGGAGLRALLWIPQALLFAYAAGRSYTAFKKAVKAPPAEGELRREVMARATGLASLWNFYAAYDLARLAPSSLDGNPYKDFTTAELSNVTLAIKPAAAKERFGQLCQVVKQRVEQAFLADGRIIPARLLNVAVVPAPAGATCSVHSTAATIVCARCGTFLCGACTSRTARHCVPCTELELASK